MQNKKMKHHEYHLLNPSPWPLSISCSILIFMLGLTTTLHKWQFGKATLIVGLMLLATVLYFWWKDVIKEGTVDKAHTDPVRRGFKIGMAVLIISEIMFFVAFFWSFFRAWLDPVYVFADLSPIKRLAWPPEGIVAPDPWSIPFMNTLILLLSGTTINTSHHYLLKNEQKSMIKMLGITILLGMLFVAVQGIEYYEAKFSLKEAGEHLIYSSNFYMMTGFHCVHVIVGIIFLIVCWFRAKRAHFTSQHHVCFEFAAWYWHFVDVVWILLFIFLYWLSI
ncbi:MAG: putative cytochrome c oxidase subunit 3 [Candidatus Mesenet longicola]|nr:MAG: putative cytochrome c oxidase subunit 3 [Candidatus Mesenet longicola]